MTKPRLTYAEVFGPRIDLGNLEWEVSKLYLDGEEVIYAGHHADTLIWLKRKNTVKPYQQSDVLPRLRLTK